MIVLPIWAAHGANTQQDRLFRTKRPPHAQRGLEYIALRFLAATAIATSLPRHRRGTSRICPLSSWLPYRQKNQMRHLPFPCSRRPSQRCAVGWLTENRNGLAAANDIFATGVRDGFRGRWHVFLVIWLCIRHVDLRDNICRRFGLGMECLNGSSADRNSSQDRQCDGVSRFIVSSR